MALFDTAIRVLTDAGQHPLRLATPPKHLPAAACSSVLRSLLKGGYVEECPAPFEYIGLGWRQQDGAWTALRVTDAGLLAIGEEPQGSGQATLDAGLGAAASEAPEVAHGALPTASAAREGQQAPDAADSAPEAATTVPASTASTSIRNAARQVLSAWNDEASQRADLPDAMAVLRAVLVTPAPAARAAGPREPREDTKQQQVLALLRRPEGATVVQVADATGWQAHTVRGLFAGLKTPGPRGRGCRSDPAGRTRQGRRQGQLHRLPHCRGGLMRRALHGAAKLAVGYLRVSTAEQGQSGLGLEAQ
ncbi:DUF3489 domain-containing protein [Dankookia sp. P2]|uniref:DUF3489 domain-containing protein n=1 Tax=Dankookia sp. P2 TaxID=3423955 RepID=UPI003D663D30